MTHNPLACRECGGTGVVVMDGELAPCVNCDAGQNALGRNEPLDRAPGADVLARRDLAEAAGVPIGAMQTGVPVRAILVADKLLTATARSLALLLTADGGKPPKKVLDDARAVLRELPPLYAEGVGEELLARALTEPARGRTVTAAPLQPPS